MHVAADVESAASPELLWRLLVDWDRHPDWMLGTRMRVVSGDGASVGSDLVAVTGIGAFGFSDSMRLVEWDPPRRCAVVHTGRVVRGSGAFEVVPVPGGRTRVVWTERLELPFGRLGRLCWPLVRPVAQAGLAYSLRRLAHLADRP